VTWLRRYRAVDAESLPIRAAAMTVQILDPCKVQTLAAHIGLAESFEPEIRDKLRALATQLDGKPVLPVLGAGASVDSGVRLAGQISQGMYNDYINDAAFAHDQIVADPTNLGVVAQAIYNESDQATAVRVLRLHEPAAWPVAEEITEHFGVYRVIARLVREGLCSNAVGFNYDCQSEAALDVEGFQRSPSSTAGMRWRDHAQIITDRATQSALAERGSYRLYKAHGCAARYRELAPSGEEAAAETIILRSSQLNSWRRDLWIRDAFRARAREHVLLLIGLSGNAAVVAGELQLTLEDVFEGIEAEGHPRVVVIDYQPNTPQLTAMIGFGLARAALAPGAVSNVRTAAGSTTAAMLVLLGEWLSLRLGPAFTAAGFDLPAAPSPRLTALTITAPVMLRWSYLLRPGQVNDFVQQINLYQAAKYGYVPLQADTARTAIALRTRAIIRERLGMAADEGPREALADSGFIVKGDKAYMPVGLSLQELDVACRPGGPLVDARTVLPHPPAHGLDCILVPTSTNCDQGVNMFSSAVVPVP
jgi:hypothetical protein